jgi:hypothetical protein
VTVLPMEIVDLSARSLLVPADHDAILPLFVAVDDSTDTKYGLNPG